MNLFWLTYGTEDGLRTAVVIEGSSLIEARVFAAMRGVDELAEFREGHSLDAATAARVPAGQIGRMLSPLEARRLLRRLGGT